MKKIKNKKNHIERRRKQGRAVVMANQWLILSLMIACCFTAISANEATESKEFVLTLDRSNFSDVVSKHKFIVVEFYAPW